MDESAGQDSVTCKISGQSEISVAREGIRVLGAEGGIDGKVVCLFIIYPICQELYISIFFNLHNVPLRRKLPFQRPLPESWDLSSQSTLSRGQSWPDPRPPRAALSPPQSSMT